MKYRIKKESKPNLATFGKYKAVAVHDKTIESKQLVKEVARRMYIHEGTINGVIMTLAEVVNSHLRDGDRVRMMKLEIESAKVDDPKTFRAKKHIRGVRIHFLPKSDEGTQELYEGITFEKEK